MCFDLVKEYEINDETSRDPSLSCSKVDREVDESMDLLVGYNLCVSSISNFDTFKFKLDYCLEETVLPRISKFDILTWWKTNGVKYPTLQRVAKDIMAITMSSVASKSVFSISGKHVTQHRNKFHLDILEALICAQNWYGQNC